MRNQDIYTITRFISQGNLRAAEKNLRHWRHQLQTSAKETMALALLALGEGNPRLAIKILYTIEDKTERTHLLFRNRLQKFLENKDLDIGDFEALPSTAIANIIRALSPAPAPFQRALFS